MIPGTIEEIERRIDTATRLMNRSLMVALNSPKGSKRQQEAASDAIAWERELGFLEFVLSAKQQNIIE